ncbi:unnamed protein product [Hymenolepis diminuta]|uniref:Uncharacterized protein n=1 Tax=Hymenolepis diminuta TaxID=6216 RepID=A0A0R3S7U4_HYMDI|nr:unnamed protein product [Hymenolepis diminuta]
MNAVKVSGMFNVANEKKNVVISNHPRTPRPKSHGSCRNVYERSFVKSLEEPDFDDCPVTIKRPRRNSRSCNFIIDKEPSNLSSKSGIANNACGDSTETKSGSRNNLSPSTPKRGRPGRKSALLKISNQDGDVESTKTTLPSKHNPALPEWLQNKLTDSSLKPLDTIFEDRLLDKNKRIPPARSKISNFSTPSRITRRSTFAKSSSVPKEIDSWSKICLPRQLIFVTWEELYPSESEDENWKKLLKKSTKDKRRSLLSKLRSMNKRPGDVFRVSKETEKNLEKFWAEMRDDLIV